MTIDLQEIEWVAILAAADCVAEENPLAGDDAPFHHAVLHNAVQSLRDALSQKGICFDEEREACRQQQAAAAEAHVNTSCTDGWN